MSCRTKPEWRFAGLDEQSLLRIDDYYDCISSSFDDVYRAAGAYAHPPWSELSEELTAITSKLFEHSVTTVVDCGCGTGHWSAQLVSTAREVWLLDVSSGMLRIAETKLRALNPLAEIRPLKFNMLTNECPETLPTNADCSLLGFVLSHYDDADCVTLIQRAVSMSRSVFIVDSLAGLSAPTYGFVQKQHRHQGRWIGVKKRYPTQQEWQSLLERAGLTLESIQVSRNFFAAWAMS